MEPIFAKNSLCLDQKAQLEVQVVAGEMTSWVELRQTRLVEEVESRDFVRLDVRSDLGGRSEVLPPLLENQVEMAVLAVLPVLAVDQPL